MGVPILAKTVFSTGADDSVATVDVYNANSDNQVVTSVASVTEKPAATIVDTVKATNSKITAQNLSSVLSTAKLAMSTKSVSQVLTRLTSNNDTSSWFSGLSKSAGTSIASVCGKIGMSDKVSTNIGGIVSNISINNLTSVKNIQGLVRNITGLNSLKIGDSSSKIAAAAAVINMASKLGVSGLAGITLGSLDKKSLINSVTKLAIKGVAKAASTIDFKALISGSTKGAAECGMPSLANNFASSYVTTNATSISTKVADYTSTLSTFSSANTSWDSLTRTVAGKTESVTNVSSLLTSSKDTTSGFKSVLVAGATGSADAKATDYLLATQLTKDDSVSGLSDMASSTGLTLSKSVSSQVKTFF